MTDENNKLIGKSNKLSAYTIRYSRQNTGKYFLTQFKRNRLSFRCIHSVQSKIFEHNAKVIWKLDIAYSHWRDLQVPKQNALFLNIGFIVSTKKSHKSVHNKELRT